MIPQPQSQPTHQQNKTIQETTTQNHHSKNNGQILNANIHTNKYITKHTRPIHLIIELTNEKTDNGKNVDCDDNYGDMIDNRNDPGDDTVEKIHEFSLPPSQPPSPPTPNPTPNPSPNKPWWHNHDYKPTINEIKQYRKQRRKMIIPKIMGRLQMQTSKQINILRNTPGQKNWQSNYHDHIIRDDASYRRIKQYIINNPTNWNDDTFNVENNRRENS